MHLYEAHLAVADTSAAQRFYIEIVGLQFAHHDLTRDIVFLKPILEARASLQSLRLTPAFAKSYGVAGCRLYSLML